MSDIKYDFQYTESVGGGHRSEDIKQIENKKPINPNTPVTPVNEKIITVTCSPFISSTSISCEIAISSNFGKGYVPTKRNPIEKCSVFELLREIPFITEAQRAELIKRCGTSNEVDNAVKLVLRPIVEALRQVNEVIGADSGCSTKQRYATALRILGIRTEKKGRKNRFGKYLIFEYAEEVARRDPERRQETRLEVLKEMAKRYQTSTQGILRALHRSKKNLEAIGYRFLTSVLPNLWGE